jgi:probable rRNA maturation factor
MITFNKLYWPSEIPQTQISINWIEKVININGRSVGRIDFVFCNDEYLLHINKTFLKHDFYTDIITFNHSENNQFVSGDIFISLERVEENAGLMNCSFQDELERIVIHGVLHLLGHNDSTESEKSLMRAQEDSCLRLLHLTN